MGQQSCALKVVSDRVITVGLSAQRWSGKLHPNYPDGSNQFVSFQSKLAKVLNPIVRPLAERVPPFAVLHHKGRRSGREYSTPVQAYPTKSGGFVVALGYGYNSDWALNLLAAGGGAFTRQGKRYTLTKPRRAGRDEALEQATSGLKILGGFKDFLIFDAVLADQSH